MTDQKDAVGDDKLTASIKQVTQEDKPTRRVNDGEVALVQLPTIVKCMRCSDLMMLTPKQEKQYVKETGTGLLYNQPCHYSLGNNACPAKQLVISEYVDHERVVSLYVEALQEGNAERMSSILNRINSKDEVTSKFLMSKIREATTAKIETVNVDVDTEFTQENNQNLNKNTPQDDISIETDESEEQKSPQ